MAFWDDVGNFFGGLFGGNKEDDERKRKQQQTQVKTQTPQPLNLNNTQNQPWARPNTPTLQPYTPQNNIPNQQPQQSELASLVQNKPKAVSQPLTPAQTDLFKGGKGYGVLTNDAMRERLPQRMAESVASQPKPKPVVVPNQNQKFMEQLQTSPKARLDEEMQRAKDWAEKSGDIIRNNDIDAYNRLERESQRRISRMAEDNVRNANPLVESELARLNASKQFLSDIQSRGESKTGNVLTLVDDLIRGGAMDIADSPLRRLSGSAEKIYNTATGNTSGVVKTQQDLDNLNALYSSGAIDYNTLMTAFKNSPALYNAGVNYGIDESGGIRNLNSVGEKTGAFVKDVLSGGLKASEYMPIGFASGASSLLGRFGSRALQGGLYNMGANLGSNALNTASTKTGDEIAQEAVMSGLFGGVLEGVGGRRLGTPMQQALKDAPVLNNLMGNKKFTDDVIGSPSTRPNSPITSPHNNPAQKESGISSPNRPEGMNKAQNFPAKTEPQPVVTQPVPRPESQPVHPQPEPAYQTSPQTLQDAIGEPNAQLAPQRPVEPVTAPESPLQPIQRQLDQQILEPPRPEPVAPAQVVDTPAQVQARQVVEQQMTQPELTPEQVAEIEARQAVQNAPTEAMANDLKAVERVQAPRKEGKEIPDSLKEEVERLNIEKYDNPLPVRGYDIEADERAALEFSKKQREGLDGIETDELRRSLDDYKKNKPAVQKLLLDFQAKTKSIDQSKLSKVASNKLSREASEVERQVLQLYHEAPNMDGGKIYSAPSIDPDVRFQTQGDPIVVSDGVKYVYITDVDGSDYYLYKQSELKPAHTEKTGVKAPDPQPPKAEAPQATSDPTAALKQEALEYKSADEFVSKNRLAAEARITELQKQIDDGERIVDSLMRKTRKAPNTEEAIKFESQAQVIRKQLRPLKEEQFGLKDALDSRYGEDSIYIQTPAEREAFLKSTGHFKARELKTAVKKYTDLYNQAHTEAKAPAPEPQPSRSADLAPLGRAADRAAESQKAIDARKVASGEEAMNSISAKSEPAPVKAEPKPKPVDDLTAEVAQSKRELQELDDILAKEGKTYEDLQGKLYRNEARISGRLSGAEEALTPAEKEAFDKLKTITDDSAERLLRNTLNEVDINRRTSYAPAGYVDELDIPKSVKESADKISDADFNKARGKSDSVMSDKPLSENARRAYERERVNALASERYNRDTLVDVRTQQNLHKDQDVFEGPLKEVKDASPVRLDEKELTTLTERNNKLANKEADYIEAIREARKTDTPESAEKVNKTHAEVIRSKAEKNVELLDMVDKKFKARDKELALERKTANSARRAEIDKERKSLVDRLEAAHANIHYMQSAIDTNLLLQPRGRLADTIQASTELPSQKLADPLARGFANRSSVKHGGEKVFGNQRQANKLYNELKKEGLIKATRRANLESNIALTKSQKTLGGKISKGYRTVGTAATEFASSEKKPLIDTINILRQRAKNMGMSDKAADNYARSRVGTQEWDEIYKMNYNVANSFTGVATMGRKSGDIIERALTKADHVTKGAINGIPNLSIGQKQTLSKLIQRVGIGYTRAAYRVTKNSISRSVLGTDSMVRAARVRGNTPAANMQRAMYVRKAVQDAQIGTGFGVAGMGIGLALGADGRVSGGYPEDKNERARWEREGITPYSIKLGDNWVNFSRYVPQAYVPVMLGGLMGSKDGLTVGDVGGIFQSVLTGAYENTGIAGVVSTLNAVTTDPNDSKFKNGITNLVNSTITMLTPGSGLLSTAARATDDVKRDTKDPNALAEIGNKVKSGLPGMRNTLDEKTDTFGEPVKDTKWNALFYVAKGSESSPVTAELNRLHKDAGLEAFPVNNKYEVKDADGNALDLSSSQRRAMDNAVKKEKAQNAEVLMSTDTYKKASDQEKKDMLTKAYSLDSSAVASKWAKDNGIANVKDTAETVNNSLELSDKQAILESKVQGDKKDKWLENNDNAANYYRADYNNAKANGTLTDKDENLNEKSGKKYKMISAQVDKDFGADQELKRLYGAIGSSEIKNYFNPEHDMYDPELGERLLAFDQARTAKGVSRNSNFSDKPKYNATKARGGSSGGSRGSGGKAKGYNLPTNLLSSKGNAMPEIKRGERLFKAPTLVSTANKTKSRIPNISVKKGIHL